MSGLELLAEWRASPRTADMPVFVLTGKDLTAEEKKYLLSHTESLFLNEQDWGLAPAFGARHSPAPIDGGVSLALT